MKKTRFMLMIVLGLLCLLASGCVVRHGDFTVMSNKLMRLSEFNLDQESRTPGVVGRDVQHIVIFFPIGSTPLLEEALDDGLSKGNGDVYTDCVVKSWGWYIPYIYGQAGWSVTGDVVKTRRY